MKIFKSILLTLTFFLIITCDDDEIIHDINNDINSYVYTSNFQSLNEGVEKYSVQLSWEEYNGDFISYDILSAQDNALLFPTIASKSITSCTISMGLNEVKTIILAVNGVEEDRIDVFTRPVSPVSNLISEGLETDSKIISWTPSTDNDITQTVLYRIDLVGDALPEINDSNGNPGDDWLEIAEGLPSLSSYTNNNLNSILTYYYIVKVTDSSGGYRYSTMISIPTASIEDGTISSSITLEALDQGVNHTYFRWDSYDNTDFYELQIWRTNPNQTETLVINTTDNSLTFFKDYTINGDNSGSLTEWHYKIRVYNIYGHSIDSNEITCETGI